MTYTGPWSYHTVLVESIMGGALSFKKHIYSRVHKNVLASMDSFPLHKNTEWGDFFLTHPDN